MRSRTTVAIGLLGVLPACGRGATDTDAALATFERFQQVLFARDAAAARGLVTEESAPVIAAMPWDRVAAQQPLVATDAAVRPGCFHVAVRDPNAGDAAGIYVVCRENGRLVVDLVATAALHASPSGDDGSQQFDLRALTPEDHDELRRRQLAAPPGAEIR